MSNEPLKTSEYEISEQYLADLASEFHGQVLYPAGNHQVAHLSFAAAPESERADLRAAFLRALESFRAA